MPTLTITTTGPLKANVEITGNTIREPEVIDLGGGLVSVELGGAEVSAILTGRPDDDHHDQARPHMGLADPHLKGGGVMGIDTAIVGSAILLALIWPLYQQLEMRALRRSIHRMRDAQRQHARALVHLQTTVTGQPAQVHAPMPTVTKVTATISGDRRLQAHTPNDRQRCAQGGPVNPGLWGRENGPELFVPYDGPSAAQVSPGRSSHRGAAPGDERIASGDRPGSREPSSPPDPDQTLRLGPPPSLTRIGELCHAAGLNPPRESLARIAAIEQHLAAGRPTTRMELARALNLQPWEISADLHTAVLARIVTTTSGHHTAGETAYTLPDPTIRMARMPLLPGAA